MKSIKKQLIFGLTFLSLSTFVACGGGTQKTDSAEDKTEDSNKSKHEVVEFNATESAVVGDLVDAYLVLKEALVNDDETAANKAAERLNESAKDIEVSEFEESVHVELNEALAEFDKMTAEMLDSDIKEQRAVFEEMTTTFRAILKMVGVDRTLYVQYCPMYNGNKGGYWLSDKAEIFNPLFGSSMLNCGVVKLEIKTQK